MERAWPPRESTRTWQASEQGIWLLDLVRGVSTRFTFDVAPDSAPVWSPDGRRLAFTAFRAGGTGIYQKAANGAGKEQALVDATGDPKFPNDWSRDGRFLLYTQQDARPMPIYGSCLWQVTGHRPALLHRLQIRSSARNRAVSLPTHTGSLMLRTSPADPKSMFNLFRRPRAAAARRRSPVTVATSPAGGGMARNYSIFPSTEN